jgi:hypothetical protein
MVRIMKIKLINRRDGKWHNWFAWHPVLTEARDVAWLASVQRRWDAEANFRVIHACDPGMCDGGWEYRSAK